MATVKGVDGIVHLAAVSRVVWGEQNPELCVATNVDALDNLLRTCLNQAKRPGMIFVSSREVYGNSDRLPVHEDAPLLPAVHFATGQGMTLGQLAQIAATYVRAPVEIVEAPKRDYDATRFIGDPSRAKQILGWRAKITIDAGVRDLVDRLRQVGVKQAEMAETQPAL